MNRLYVGHADAVSITTVSSTVNAGNERFTTREWSPRSRKEVPTEVMEKGG